MVPTPTEETDNTELQWFSRSGRPLSVSDYIRDQDPAKGRATYRYEVVCSRCGGRGGSEAWAHTGYTCYQCNGSGGRESRVGKAYTREALDKLIAASEARQAKSEAAAKIKAELQAARDLEEFVAWLPSVNGTVILWAGTQTESTFAFLADMAHRVNTYRVLSAAQYNALVKCWTHTQERAATAENSKYLADVGEQLIDVQARMTRFIELEPDQNPYHAPVRRYLREFTTPDGQVLVYFGSSKYMPMEVSDALFLIGGKVKDHKEYRGVKQTIIKRPTIKELEVSDHE